MSDHLNKKVLLIGASQMAIDYYNVLKELGCNTTIVGRSIDSATNFENKTGVKIITGGIEKFLSDNKSNFDVAIVAVGMEQLAATTTLLIKNGILNILLEKPAGLNSSEIKALALVAEQYKANVRIAYNRRFYSSVLKAKEIIAQDGGVTSFNFEFTEWSHVIEPLQKQKGVKQNWLLGNSTHVIDLAFYLGGSPTDIACFAEGKLSWHEKAVFSGAGKTATNVLFSYQANWNAPGRWVVEILTKNSRLIFKPLEELQIQLKGSVQINKVEIDNKLDTLFKPGLYLQTKEFLTGNLSEFKTIAEQAKMVDIYDKIAKGC